MSTTTQTTVWELGDYDRVARDVIPAFGPELVAACKIGPGDRVLDVGAGSGNVAVEAAVAGATVVASDPAAGLLAIAASRARERGVELECVQADAQALPFADGAFDVVTSSVGVMFAPDHHAAASELVRVCRPGGRIGLINWTPDGTAGELFSVFARYAPAAGPPPAYWGSEPYVRGLLGAAVTNVEATTATLLKEFPSPDAFCEYYRRHFGPIIATYAELDSARHEELDRDFADFAARSNRGVAGGPAVYHFAYTRIVAERR
jgi:ubiquinone/menaquinone biosynthesis C-methylase UbiE